MVHLLDVKVCVDVNGLVLETNYYENIVMEKRKIY